jgi:hypothetical protein
VWCLSIRVAVRCQRQVVIVSRTLGAQSINWSLDRRRIGAIVWSGRDSRRSGAIGLSMVCGRAVPYRVGSVADWHGVLLQGWFAGISVSTVIRFVAAVDTGSSFFVLCLRDCAVPTAPPLTSLSLHGTLHENFLSKSR